RGVTGDSAHARRRVSQGPKDGRALRAPRRPRRRRSGMAVSSRQDGGTHNRDEARHGRLERCRISAHHHPASPIPRSLGYPVAAIGSAFPITVNLLAHHYSRFRVSERLLLTGHSHQAWPDVAFEAQQRAWLDAAEFVDDKWSAAAAQAEKVRQHWKLLLN